MQIAAQVVSIVLYSIVGAISLVMARKSLILNGFIPFHRKAAGVTFEKLDHGVQNVILGLMRTTGLGFLVVAVLLLVFPTISYFSGDIFAALGIPLLCAIYCFGLFLVNYRLHKQSGAATPWRGSLASVAAIVAGIIIAAL